MITDALAELARAAAETHHCPSIAWGVVRDGKLAERGATGALADGDPPDEHTVYRIASMTKSFSAAVVLALRDDGVLRLDDPVAELAPELGTVTGPPGSPAITLRHLLSMASGLATDDAWADRHLDITADQIDAVYAAGPLFAHRTNDVFEYSNLGYGMIGRVVLRATGTRLQDHVTERLLGPLGLTSTTWTRPEGVRWAEPRRVVDGAIVPDLLPPLGDGEISPMGGLWTTVADLARWVAWLDEANAQPDRTASHATTPVGLSASSRRELQRMQTYIGVTTLAGRTSPSGYGFGLNVRDDSELGTVIAHSGGLPGYGSNMRWLKGRGVGAVAVANMFYAPMGELTLQMLAALHEQGATPTTAPIYAPDLRAAAAGLVALLNDWSDDVAHDVFADNVALDESFDRRAAAARALVERHGPLRVVDVQPESLTSGSVEVQGTGAPFRILFDLAPLHGAPVQFYELGE